MKLYAAVQIMKPGRRQSIASSQRPSKGVALGGILALRADLDESIRSGIFHALLGMEDDPKGARILRNFGDSRFIRTTNEDYIPVFEYADSIGMDLTTYTGTDDQ